MSRVSEYASRARGSSSPRYNGYAATCDRGLVKLYNPFSVVSALEVNKILNFWVETGKIIETIKQSKFDELYRVVLSVIAKPLARWCGVS
jgi:hypothetical protein